jgi:glycopeptide antibiotics resistance protein
MPESERTSASLPRRRLFFVTAAYTAFVIYGSLVPLRYEPLSLADALARFRNIPFLQLGAGERADWVANVLLFVPLGFLASGVVAGSCRGWRLLVALPPVVAVCCALSVAIEFAQLWFPQRTVSQNDIAAEALGATIGVGLWLAIGPAVARWLNSWSRPATSASRVDKLLWAYALGLVMYSVMPLDLTISVTELYDKYHAGRINFTPFRHAWPLTLQSAYELVRDLATFVPIGALAYRQCPGATPRTRFLGGVLTGVAVVAGIEAAQTVVLSRFADVTDLATGGLGVFAGAALARSRSGAAETASSQRDRDFQHFGSHRAAWRLVAQAIAYCAILFVAAWYPFAFDFDPAFLKPRIESFIAAPFTTLYLGPEFAALTNALGHITWFLPLGVLADRCSRLIADRPASRRAILTLSLLLIVAAAVAMEVGQIAIPSRTGSLDGVLLRFIGAAAGLGLSRFLTPLRPPAPGRPAEAR